MKKKKLEMNTERKARYIELLFAYLEIKDKLKNEFPDKFYDSNRSFAQKMLNARLIKCQHEK